MLVEISGALGSGKSVIAALVANRLNAGGVSARVVKAGGGSAADLHLMRWAPVFAVRHPRLWRLLVRATWRDADSMRARAVLLWNLMRKAGMYERLRRTATAEVVIWDEGTIHMAHNAFVHIRRAPRREDVLHFGELVPKPDLLVVVRASSDVAQARVLVRGHKRSAGDASAVHALVMHAQQVFSALTEVESVRERALEIDNDAARLDDLRDQVEVIAALVCQSQSEGKR